jgi:phage terminase small subunit
LAHDEHTKLTPKQDLFIGEYLISFNAADAYRKAGYSHNRANEEACRMLARPNVQREVQRRYTAIKEGQGVTQARVVAEMAKVAFASMRNFVRIDEEGQPQIDLTDTPDDDLDALSEVSTETVIERDGVNEIRKTKIKLHDKLAALEKLARYTGVYDKETEKAAGAFADAISDIQSRMSRAPIKRDTEQDDDK